MASIARLEQTVARLTDPVLRRLRFGIRSFWTNRESCQNSFLDDRLRAHSPVFIFQMGKVGSTSIYKSLLDSSYSGAIFHGHTFDRFHSDDRIRKLHSHFSSTRTKLKIITLIREPVTRNISAFFQNFKRDTGKSFADFRKSPAELKRIFMKNYPHEVPLIWFDQHLKPNFGIDVYQAPFPTEKGYQIFSSENVDVLLMKHDLTNEIKENLIREFTEIDEFKIRSHNTSSTKEYAEYYQAMQKLKLPLEHLYYLASSKYMQHFYRPEMRRIIHSWSDRPIPVKAA
ncbi:MAG: putative capsular polysaccharide synthesis family protein [Planctomycetota bacterium]